MQPAETATIDPPRDAAPADPTPASPLVVHSGRSTLVATDALLAHLPELDAFADAIESDAHRLALLALDAPYGILRTRLERCELAGIELADEVRRLRRAIAIAQSSYELGERTVMSLQDAASAWATGTLARLAPPLLPVIGVNAAMAWKRLPGGDAQKKEALQSLLLEHPELITSPEFATLVRRVVSNTDDAVLGASGLPPWVAMMLGEQGLGILGVDTSAGVLIAVGSASAGRAFHETPVRVERVSESPTATAPSGAAQRLDRVPGDEQVRIEQYTTPGRPPRYVVYVAPTQTFSPVAGEEPWDLTSNVAGVAGLPAGSIRATEQAMADAGITADSEVVLVGFSQGGLVADAVAASGRWNTVGLETYGDPGGGIELPEGIRGVAVRHSDDFVVATGGAQQPSDRTIVERRAYPEGASIPTDLPAPAHQRRAYAETARLLDAAQSPEVRAELDALDAFTREYTSQDGSQITTMSYRAERVPTG
ncbi:MAG: hypothetical protein ACTHMQ_02385 [Protaetiibacter sp.]